MKLTEYVYFSIKSKSLTPDAITARVELSPDAVRARSGAARTASWTIGRTRAGSPAGETSVTAQVAAVMERLGGHEAAIRELCVSPDTNCALVIVRGYEPNRTEARMGISVSAETIAMLHAMNCGIEIDEYDYSGGSAT